MRKQPSGKKVTHTSLGLVPKQLTPNTDPGSKAALEDSMMRQGIGAEEMAKRLNTFQGPWKGNLVSGADDNNFS